MTLSDAARIALTALWVNLFRSFLTILGVVIGVSAFVTLMAIGDGARTQISKEIRSLGANLLLIRPEVQQSGGVRLGSRTRRTLVTGDAVAIVEQVPAAEIAAPAIETRAQVVFGSRNWSTAVVGAWPEHLAARNWTLGAGRNFTRDEVRRAAKVVVIGATVVREAFAGADAVGKTIRIGDVPFEVIGVLAKKGNSPFGADQDDVAFTPLTTAKLRLGGTRGEAAPHAVDHIYVKVATSDAVPEATEQIRRLLRKRHNIGDGRPDDFRLDDLAALVAAQEKAGDTFNVFLAVVALVSLAVGGVSIMNIMLVSVSERTSEIALRIAVGARPRDVRNQFLVEAVLLCAAGGLAGILLGVAGAHFAADATGWPIRLAPWTIALAGSLSVLIGVSFGLYPALKAARLDPMVILRNT